MADADQVFKALADPSRRRLLDKLFARSGQTLGALCGDLEMSRQAVTQHLQVLEAAHLVSVERVGRLKLHYLNPVPIHDVFDRWIRKFERPRLRALSEFKRRLEGGRTWARRSSSTWSTSRRRPGRPGTRSSRAS